MAASVKIEFDDGSRVISQKVEDTEEGGGAERGVSRKDVRPKSCSIDVFYEIPKTTEFIAKGNFQRVALQFPDSLLREAPEVLWTLQARVRKRAKAGPVAGAGGALEREPSKGESLGGGGGEEGEPLIFVTGDTSYGSCCVDEVSAQHLKADAIVHYGRSCLSPTNSSVPVLYVFGKGQLDVQDLATTLLSGPLAPPPRLSPSQAVTAISDPDSKAGEEAKRDILKLTVGNEVRDLCDGGRGGGGAGGAGGSKESTGAGKETQAAGVDPVLLLYDVTYSHAIPSLLEALGEGYVRGGNGGARLVVGYPTPQAYSPNGRSSNSSSSSSSSSSSKVAVVDEGTDAGPVVSACRRGEDNEAAGCGCAATATATRQGKDAAKALLSEDYPPAAAATATAPTPTTKDSIALSLATMPSLAEQATKNETPSVADIRIGGLGVEVESEEALKRYKLFFVGGEGRQLTNVLLRCAGCRDRLRYDPLLPRGERLVAETGRGNRDLMRRYYLVQRAREAGVIGIVVGTLGVQRYGNVVRSLRRMIEGAGRKAYTLAVGKINVAKLANFAEVDVFCLVACAENSLLDSKEFHAPVVTPFELEVALGHREWNGFYSTDFDDVPNLTETWTSTTTKNNSDGGSNQVSVEPTRDVGLNSQDSDNDSDGDRPFFSLVSGTYKTVAGVSKYAEAAGGAGIGASLDHDPNNAGGALVGIGERSLVEWSSPAADFLAQREYQGLEALVGQTEARPAVEGQSGIASDYTGL